MDRHLFTAMDQMMVLELGKLPLLPVLLSPTATRCTVPGFISTECPFRDTQHSSSKSNINSLSTRVILFLLTLRDSIVVLLIPIYLNLRRLRFPLKETTSHVYQR